MNCRFCHKKCSEIWNKGRSYCNFLCDNHKGMYIFFYESSFTETTYLFDCYELTTHEGKRNYTVLFKHKLLSNVDYCLDTSEDVSFFLDKTMGFDQSDPDEVFVEDLIYDLNPDNAKQFAARIEKAIIFS